MKKGDVPLHQWTNGGDEVLLVKYVADDGSAYGGFRWPLEIGSLVEAPDWRGDNRCGGGLHGWPWGHGIGHGKPISVHHGKFVVFAARPEDTVQVEQNKAKCRKATVRLVGTFGEVMHFVSEGFRNWVSDSAAHSSLSATGERSSLSATGNESSLSATGKRSSLSATGKRSSLSATGGYSSLSATGNDSSLSATGNESSLSATGWDSSLSATGERSSLSATGNDSSLSATGERSSLSATGEHSSLSATGERSIAAVSGEYSSVEVGRDGVAVATSTDVWWIARPGSVFIQSGEGWYVAVSALELGAADGERIHFVDGEIVERRRS